MSRYDVDKFDPAPDPDLICCICQCVLDGAVECPCRHVFCRVCIETWLRNRHTCPTCRDTLRKTDLKPVLPLVQNMLNRLLMSCDFRVNGCPEKIMLEHFEAHVKTCGYERCVCRFVKCGLSILRKHLKQHEDDECDHRELQCTQGCSLMVPLNQAVTHNCIQALKDHITEKNNLIETLKSRLQELNSLTQSLNEQIEELRRHVEEPQNDSFISDTSDTDFTEFSSDVSMHEDEDENQTTRHVHIIHTDNPASPDDSRVVHLPLELINFENRYSLRSRTTQQQHLPTQYQAGVNVSVTSSVSSTSQTNHQPQTSTSITYFSSSLSQLPSLRVSSSQTVNQNLLRYSDVQMSRDGNRSSQQNSNQSSVSATDSGTLQVAPASVTFHSESNNNHLDMSSEQAEPEVVDSDSALSPLSQYSSDTFDYLSSPPASGSTFVDDEGEDGNGEDDSGDDNDEDDDENCDYDYYSEQRDPSTPGSNSSFHSSWTNTSYQSEHLRSSPVNTDCDNRSVSGKSTDSTLQSSRSHESFSIQSEGNDWGISPSQRRWSQQSNSSSINTWSSHDSENKDSSLRRYSSHSDSSDRESSSRHCISSSSKPQIDSARSEEDSAPHTSTHDEDAGQNTCSSNKPQIDSARSEEDSAPHNSVHDEDAVSSISNRTCNSDHFAVSEYSHQLAVNVAEQSHHSDWNCSDAEQNTIADGFESDASFSPPDRYIESHSDSDFDGVKSESVMVNQHSGSHKSHSSRESNSTERSPSSSESTETVTSHVSNTSDSSGLDGSSDSEGWTCEEAADSNQPSEDQPSKHIIHGVYRTSTQTSNSLTTPSINQLWSKSNFSSNAVQLPTVTSSGHNHHWNQTDQSAISFKSERSSVSHVITSTHHNALHSTNKAKSTIVQLRSEAPVIVITDSEEEASKRSIDSKPVQRIMTEMESQPRNSLTWPRYRLFKENNQQRALPGYSGLGTSSTSIGTKDINKKRKFDSVSEHLVNGTSLPSYKRCKVETVGTQVWGQSNSTAISQSVPPSVNVQIDLSLFNISGNTLLGQPLVPTVVPENNTQFSRSADKKAVPSNSSTQVSPLLVAGVANGDAQNRNVLKENNSGFAVSRPVETVDTRRVEHGTSSRCKPIAIMGRNNVYKATNITSSGGWSAPQQTSDQDLSDTDGTDDTWEPDDNSLQMSDDTISDDIESDESYEVLVPKSIAELLDECDSGDTDVSWAPDMED